ncbi:MAG: LysR family transcriptional regulator [Opitutaceae bacterium]|nr:LysR family transcriptional regulator [Opitutaceae bacterium]
MAVAKEENVSRAALNLHVSQPALSRQIRDLEDEIGFLLLKRSAKSVHLTEAGRTFLVESQAVLRRADEAVQAARDVASGLREELNVGYAPMPTVKFLPPALRAFRKQCPGVRVKLYDLSPEEMLTGLHEGRLQLAFLVRPTRAMLRGLHFEEFARDHMRLAVGRNHPLAKLRSISTQQLKDQSLVAYSRKAYPEYHAYLGALFSGARARPSIVEEHDDGVGLVTALETGLSVAILPQSLELTTGARIKLIPITPLPSPLVLGVAWVPARMTSAAEQFLNVTRRSAKGVQKEPKKARV